jgi:leucyl aminopeptidase
MKIDIVEKLDKRGKADVIVLPYWKGEKKAKAAFKGEEISDQLLLLLKSGDFKGNASEIAFLYSDVGNEPRVALVGLGEEKEVTLQTLRNAYSALVKEARKKKLETINLLLPELDKKIDDQLLCRAVVEGCLLTNYSFDRHKHMAKEDDRLSLIEKITLIGVSAKHKAICEKVQAIVEGVNFTRDLVNENADEITPQKLGELAAGLAKKYKKIKTTVFNKAQIEKEKMGLLLAVNRGASNEPRFIVMEYRGNPSSHDATAIIGKGITYDTGGLNLKPTGSMETMKCDMAGSATVLGLMKAVAELELKVNVYGVIPSTENAIGPLSFKPGDIYLSHAGKSVEISNTDAEGRLVLADAISYTVKELKPKRIIDLATLTGAIVIALGEEAIGLFSNNDELSELLKECGELTHERVWRLPTFNEYKEQLKSEIADMKNCGTRSGGSITAALFLEAFVEKTPWVHLDIAGTAYLDKPKHYNTTHASGIGVRLLTEMLERLERGK